MTARGKGAIVAGVVIVGLSPSFIDWKQSPEMRGHMILYYGIAAALVMFGLWDGEA